ncbi:hypothetical protein M408DRAFT_274497 [Serendipita vermifera MAFF 305830]|uniref:PPP4R2-domain-containing protein n=1 Tax=Serendipita vermifera MAFF 305830 TaxID=933852 RepID=A0A0C2XPZ7_SERVB|nr:hypothetical protein M408DRAFT_274497 [Serendipita vermifera MAFF 305830]
MDEEVLNKLDPEDETLLNKTINTGEVTDWPHLRQVLQSRVKANVAEFIRRGPDPLLPRSDQPATPEGRVFPPFKPRRTNPQRGPTQTLPSEMTEQQANEFVENIVGMIEGFDEAAPFTIKRVCELALLPRNHYRTVGKYLRGLERTLLVTSSPNTFAVSPAISPTQSVYASLGMEGVLKTINTPIFTPIAFLHDDARRRSQSRSPPASPVRLHNALALGDAASAPADEPKGLGLVDELDTPAPGHMASEPTPLTATTTPVSSEPPSPAVGAKTLEQRFVKSSGGGEEGKKEGEEGKNEDAEVESMVLSEDPQ